MRFSRLASAAAAGCLAATCLAAAPQPPAEAPAGEDVLIAAPPGETTVERRIEVYCADAPGRPGDVVFFFADDAPPGARPAPAQVRPARRAPLRVRVEAPRMERAAFLGVSTSPCPQVLRQQLKLPRGIGLVVDVVEPGSPAEKAGLKPFDVLHKLDDQLLVDAHQLAVLVRTRKAGDEVKLTVVREGREEVLTAALAEKEMRPLEEMRFGEFGGGPPGFAPHWEELRLPAPIDPRHRDVPVRPWPEGAPPLPRGTGLQFLWDDGQTTLIFSMRDGTRHLVAKDRSGKVLFEGPIETEEQRAKLPTDLREKIEKIRIETLPFPGQPGQPPHGELDLRDPQPRPDQPREEKDAPKPGEGTLDLRDKPADAPKPEGGEEV